MRNSYHFGHTVGAMVTELRRGSVNSGSIGCVGRNPIDGSIKLRLSCRVIGKLAKALAATLAEISISCARGEITMAQRAAQFDAAITQQAGKTAVLITPKRLLRLAEMLASGAALSGVLQRVALRTRT
jgi:hypothetical protein